MIQTIESKENDAIALEKTLAALNACQNITGFYVAGFGITGVVNAIKIKKIQGKINNPAASGRGMLFS